MAQIGRIFASEIDKNLKNTSDMNTEINISATLGSILGNGTSMDTLMDMIKDLGLEVTGISSDLQ